MINVAYYYKQVDPRPSWTLKVDDAVPLISASANQKNVHELIKNYSLNHYYKTYYPL